MAKSRGTGKSRVLKRIGLARAGIFAAMVAAIVLGFVLHLGAVSFLMRGIIFLGIAALGASYVWEFLVRWRRRSE
ncbi:MAG: hypothetical protein JWO18_2337 [Microbacteriaceae bacterium]|jgi:membrane protein implicated in regulation of membrane protease activity|nr:hypothetical protein [Microbacteriaceae bacterium]